jgi:hypothetical protein
MNDDQCGEYEAMAAFIYAAKLAVGDVAAAVLVSRLMGPAGLSCDPADTAG